MGRLEKTDKSAKVEFQSSPQEISAASDDGSDPSSARCSSCISSSTTSTHYRDFSTMSSSTREKLSQNDDQMQIMQNMFNKRSERLRKPCQNGFCYCFTSDSDELRFAANQHETRIRPKHKKPHTDKVDHIRPENRAIQRNGKCLENKSKRRITLPPSTEIKLRCDPHDNGRKCSKHNRRHTFVSKYPLPEPLTSDIDEPLVRIIQEIHRNFVISKISVNRGRIMSKKKNDGASPTVPIVTTHIEEPDKTIHIEANNIEIVEGEQKTSPLESQNLFAEHEKDLPAANIPIRPPRSPKKKGGHLLRKRIGDGNLKQKHIQTPPRKPPRSFSSCSESNIPGKNTNSPGSAKVAKQAESAKSDDADELYPNKKLSNVQKEVDAQDKGLEQPSPSCPSMSEMTFLQSPNKATQELHKNQIGWVPPDIVNMLNYESGSIIPKQFQSFQDSAQPQTMGWKPPHKLDIDTVDNIPKFRDNGFHNFAVNMECKSTPVKNELIPQNTSKLSKQQSLSKTCTCPVKPTESPATKKLSPIYESKKDSSFGKKAVDNTKNFLESSRKRIVALVRRKSSRRNSDLKRSVGIQTSQLNLTDLPYTRKSLFRTENLDDTFNAQPQTQNNGTDHTDAISSIRSQSQEQFDFSRVVNSPVPERSFSNKLIFPRPKILKTLAQRPQEQPQSYRAYDSGVNGDFTIAAMNDILGNLRARLEAAENNAAVQTLDEVAREAKEADDDNNEENPNSSTQISAQADIHTEPLYAEIRERHTSVSDQCVQTTEIPPNNFTEDTKVIYAEVDKLRKNPKCHTFNNLPDKDSPPKFRNISKSDLSNSSEVFLDNLFNPKKENLSGEYIRINMSSEDMTSPVGTSSTAPAEGFGQEEGSVQYEEPFEEHGPVSEISFGKDSSSSETGSPKDDSHSHQKLPVCMLHKDSGYYVLPERSISCPPTSQKSALRKFSLGSDDFGTINLNQSTSNCKSPNTSLQKYRTLKERLRISFRKGKKYLKNEKKRLSGALETSKSKGSVLWDQSDLGLSSLYAMDPTDETAVKRHIEQAVNICRQMPQFESSTELVEAERLLLFSTLKSRSMKRPSPKKPPSNVKDCLLYIETFEIPVACDINQDTFFNYFYIGVFSNGTNIKSTHSAEKRNNRVVFRDCQLLFDSLEVDFQIKIDIYVLRLRKMTNAQREKPVKKKSSHRNYNSSDSGDEILSRFRLHGSVLITADCFVPYQLHRECKRNLPNNKYCICAAGADYTFSISEITRSTHLLRELKMEAKAELALNKFDLEGFINVQDEKNVHNWNRRWCKLEVLTLCFWNYPQDYSEKPCILKVDLTKCTSFPIEVSDGAVCAKQRSFVIKILDKEQINGVSKELFLAAENHAELTHWLSGLNKIGEFLRNWICPVQ